MTARVQLSSSHPAPHFHLHNRSNTYAMIATTLLLAAALALPQTTTPQQHDSGVQQRGDKAMGFSHNVTNHHFTLLPDGGLILAEANDPTDAKSREEILSHMNHIVGMFSAGNFDAPMFIHARTPPEVPTMKRLRKSITYTAIPTPTGASVRVTSADPHAIAAIHDFLRFQIADHKTGDPTTISAH